MVELFTNSGEPDQMPHSAASDLGLHCLPFTHFGVSSHQRVKRKESATFQKVSNRMLTENIPTPLKLLIGIFG